MKTLFSFVLYVFVVMIFPPLSGQISDSFEFEGRIRNYDVYLPQNYQPGVEMPVIFNIHGYKATTAVHAPYTMMPYYADTAGFILVYPQGILAPNGRTAWNTGLRGHPFGPDIQDTTSNDVGFISALIDTLQANYNIDMSRIYSCGFSMGGEMTNRLAIELGHRFAAIAPVGGMLNDILGNSGVPIRPMPVMHFHGTLDEVALYYGPAYGNMWTVDEALNFWIQNNNCILLPDTIAIPDTCLSDSCHVQKISYRNCSDSTQVIHFKILQGGHTWPSADSAFALAVTGFLNRDISASQEIVNFFKNYTNPLVNIAWTKNAEFIHTGYTPSQNDTLKIKAYTVNPQNHPVSVNAKFLGASTAYIDSVILYDDGMHGDENPNDNIWGNYKILTGIPEDKYFVDIYTNDLIEGTSQKYRKLNYFFLRKGPIVFDHYQITSTDTIPNDGDRIKFEFTLKNTGLSATAMNITSKLVPLDTFSVFPYVVPNYGNIQAGHLAVGNNRQNIRFNHGLHPGIDVQFRIDIFSNNYLFWSDTFSVFVYSGLMNEDDTIIKEFALKQNYPNPFNPKTTLKFSIPKTEFVTLKIYNLLGQEVSTLISDKLTPGEYKYTWDASHLASGMYFYKLETESYSSTKKLILLR